MTAGFGVKYTPVHGQGRPLVRLSPWHGVHVVRVARRRGDRRVVPLDYWRFVVCGGHWRSIRPRSGSDGGAAVQRWAGAV